MSTPSSPAKFIALAALGSFALSALLLSTFVAVERYGVAMLLFTAALIFLGQILARTLFDVTIKARDLPIFQKQKQDGLPDGQLFQEAEDIQGARSKVRHLMMEGRKEAEVEHLCESKNIARVKEGVAAIKAGGHWPYYSLSLFSHGTHRKTFAAMHHFLDEGAFASRYNIQYDPLTFRAVKPHEEPMFDEALFERFLAMGCDVNDSDIQGRNAMELIIDTLEDRCRVHSSLVSGSVVDPFMSALSTLTDMGSRIRPEYQDKLAKCSDAMQPPSANKTKLLLSKLQSGRDKATLENSTAAATKAARPVRL